MIAPRSIVPLAVTLALLAAAPARAQDDVEIDAAPAPGGPTPADVAPPPPSASPAEVAALQAKIAALDARLAGLEAPAAAPAPSPTPPASQPSWIEVLDLRVHGYAQVQFVSSELSENEVSVEGEPLNQDRLLVRRGRVEVERSFKYAHTSVEIDVNTVDGPYVSPSGLELSGFLPSREAGRPPLVAVTVGLFDIPFGTELPESSAVRYFTERTFGSRSLFPGDSDVGVQLSGGLGPVRYAIAGINGVPLKNTPDDALVYTAEKTLVGRVGLEAGPQERWKLTAGASFLSGTGLHAGTPETKSSLLWSDSNQNGTVSLDELVAVNGQAATPSETFGQWAVGADAGVSFKTKLGWSRVFAEATMASNLDRGYLVADPVASGYDLREVAWSAGATQEVFTYGVLGFRADSYDANADLFESRRGEFIPTDVSVLTLSPLLGAQVPKLGRLLVQYDYVVDHLGRDDLGEPADLPNDQWTVRLQGEF